MGSMILYLFMIAFAIQKSCLISAKWDLVWLGAGDVCPHGSTLNDKTSAYTNTSISGYKLRNKSKDKVRIAFVGDSITQGRGSGWDKKIILNEIENGYMANGAKNGYTGYPYKLGEMLQSHNMSQQYELLNFGFDARFVEEVRNMYPFNPEWNTNSYFQTCDYHQVMLSEPDIVFFMLGTNDMLHFSHAELLKNNITSSYLKLVWQLANLTSNPEIYLMVPPPILYDKDHPNRNNGSWQSTQWMPQLIHDMAVNTKVPQSHILDLQNLFEFDKIANYYVDNCHPNDLGYSKMAQLIFDTLIKSRHQDSKVQNQNINGTNPHENQKSLQK